MDEINGGFEAIAAVMVWTNVMRLVKDRTVAGVNLWVTAWYVLWGISSLFYYLRLGHWWSLVGNVGILAANATWLTLALHFRRQAASAHAP